jgi:hypothetical protein
MPDKLKILCNTTRYIYHEFPENNELIKNTLHGRLSESDLLELVRRHDPPVQAHNYREMVSLDFLVRNSDTMDNLFESLRKKGINV